MLATGTASGKSLAYQLPALTAIRAGRGPRGQRGATVLYLAPTKALAQDQLAGLTALGARRPGHHPRRRQPPRAARLGARPRRVRPHQPRHAAPLAAARPRAVGARSSPSCATSSSTSATTTAASSAPTSPRCCAGCAGSARPTAPSPTFVLASATVAEPEAAAARLTGLDVLAVTGDGSPRGEVSLALWEPPLTSFTGENGAPVRRAASSETADLLADLVAEDVRTLAFVRSRRGAEQVALTAAELLAEVDPSLPDRVAAYRGGYLPEERRELERRCAAGELIGLAATNALELGIDVSGLDAVLMAGFPGTRAALWQQVGRAGRGARTRSASWSPATTRSTPTSSPTPRPCSAGRSRPPSSTRQPLRARARTCAPRPHELPLTEDDLPLFGPDRPRRRRRADPRRAAAPPPARLVLDRPAAGRRPRRHPLDRRPAGRSWSRPAPAGWSAPSTPAARTRPPTRGAVYVHRGETWLVESLDLDEHVAVIGRADPDYSTTAREITDITIVAEREHRRVGRVPAVVRGRSTSPTRWCRSCMRRQPSGEVIGEEPLDLPERTLRTTGGLVDRARRRPRRERGWPRSTCPAPPTPPSTARSGCCRCSPPATAGTSAASRRRVHPDTGRLTVFVYDGHPGGAGFAERGFDAAREWLTATRETDRRVRVRRGLPVVHPVAQVRQPEQPARQGRRGPAARRAARPRSVTRARPSRP